MAHCLRNNIIAPRIWESKALSISSTTVLPSCLVRSFRFPKGYPSSFFLWDKHRWMGQRGDLCLGRSLSRRNHSKLDRIHLHHCLDSDSAGDAHGSRWPVAKRRPACDEVSPQSQGGLAETRARAKRDQNFKSLPSKCIHSGPGCQ